MSDLVEFLTARLDEDEQQARSAAEENGLDWAYGDGGRIVSSSTGRIAIGPEDWPIEEHTGVHIARHDPDRVLREVEGKRRIVDLHKPPVNLGLGVCRACNFQPPPGPCRTIRVLALSYADHPDYRAEWAV